MLYINLLNLSWIMKCLFLRNMEPLTQFGLSLLPHTTYWKNRISVLGMSGYVI